MAAAFKPEFTTQKGKIMNRSKVRFALLAALAVLLSINTAAAQSQLQLRVVPGGLAGVDVPVSVKIALPKDLAKVPADEIRVTMNRNGQSGSAVPGQVVRDGDDTELCWILPSVEANEQQTWVASIAKGAASTKDAFAFKDTAGDHLDLLFAGRPVTRYMYAYDTSTPERKSATWKVYHHVFDAKGENVLTQGAGGKQYPHHRGIFFGGKLDFDGGRGDWWHGQVQAHQKFLEMTAGPVLARSTALIHWNTSEGRTVLIEERSMTAYRQTGGTLLLADFRSCVKSADGDVKLGADREHGGVQFRTHGDVDKQQTKYCFPAEDTDVRKELDLPWVAMSITLNRPDAQPYSVQHMNHPNNPEETEYSAYRDYGRFGAFFRQEIKTGQTLCVAYRFWVVPGDLPPRETLQQRWVAFAEPPKVEVVR